MSIEIKGMDALIKNLSRYPDEVIKGCVQAAQITQALIVNDARSDHPYKDRTGNLTNSIQPGDVVVDDVEVTAFVEARMEYATFVEFGTSRAHAYPFLTPAMLRQLPNFKKAIAKEVSAIRL